MSLATSWSITEPAVCRWQHFILLSRGAGGLAWSLQDRARDLCEVLEMSGYPVRKLWRREEFCTEIEYEHALYLSWFGRVLFMTRMRAGEAQAVFAERLHLQPAQLSRLENGGVDFKISMLLKIAVHVDTDPRRLFPDRGALEKEAYAMGTGMRDLPGPGRLWRAKSG